MDKKEQLFELGKIRGDLFSFLKYVKIQEPGDLALDYILWPHLVDFYNQLLNNKLLDLIKAKQIGISWALVVYALWKVMSVFGMNVLMISKGKDESQALLAKVGIVFNNLPDWIKKQPGYALSHSSTEKFGFRDMHSLITAFPSTETAGLGNTAGLVIHDESDFHEYYEVNLGHTLPTVVDNPKWQLISVSTVDKTKPDSYFKRHWKRGNGSGYPEAVGSNFKALFYPYNVRPNRDEAFYQAMVREHAEEPWKVEANYPQTIEEALSPQTATSCFNKERLGKLWDATENASETRQGFIYIFSGPRVGTKYVGGVDVGEGVGLDYSSFTILGKDGLKSEVVAKIYTNKLATDLFAYEIDKLCTEYYDPLLAVENNGLGVAVLNKLKELGRPKLFSTEADRKTKAGGKITGVEKAGWTTGEKNKQTGIVELIESVNDGSVDTKFRPQVKEMMEYQWVNGKPVPTGATHGDTVISLMLAHQMLKRVGNVQKASMFVGGRQVW